MEQLNKEEILRILSENKSALIKYGVWRIGLFGSYVRGEQREGSDIDFVVEFEEGQKTFDNFMELAFFLEETFGTTVDLLTRESMSPFIGPYISNEVVYESTR